MGLPIYQLFSGAALTNTNSTPVILDWAVVPFNVSYALELLAGTGTFGLQYTLDNPNFNTDYTSPGGNFSSGTSTVTWFADINTGASTTSSTVGNYAFPVRALRVAFGTTGASMSLQLAVLQGLPNY